MLSSALHSLAVLVLAGVLVSSAFLKLKDSAAARASVEGFTVIPGALVTPIALALPVVELVLGIGLLLTSASPFVVVSSAVLVLMVAFTVLVLLTLSRGEAPACHCFGAVSSQPISKFTVARNLALTGLAIVAVLGNPYSGFISAFAENPWLWRAFVVALAAAVGLLAWALVSLSGARDQVTSLRGELEVLKAQSRVNEQVDIPDATVVAPNGESVRLVDMVEQSGKAHLVIAVAPGCSACKDVVPMIPGWRQEIGQQIEITLVSWSGRDEALDSYPESAQHLYASPDGSALRALGVGGTPAAVILGLNGKVAAGPAHGIEAITELLGALIQAITVNAVTGRLHGPQETRALGGADTGDAHLPPEGTVLPDVMVRAEDGSESTLTQALRSLNVSDSVPVVAWRDTCPYCGEIAPDLQQFSQRSEVVLLVNEPIASVRAQGLSGPVFQTIGADASRVLMVPGTPGGMPLKDMVTQPGGGVGGGSVLRMLIDRAREAGTYIATPRLEHMEHQMAAQPVPVGARAPQLLPVVDGERNGTHSH